MRSLGHGATHMLSLSAALCCLLFGASAQAQPTPSATADAPAETTAPVAETAATESARAHFRLGVDFYRERNFRAALIEFQRAYADAPHYKLLYNLGQASLELQEYANAIDFLSAYLRQSGAEIDPERRAQVEQSIRDLESRIAHVSVMSNRAGADIYLDDTLVGRSPLSEPLRVGAGRHKLRAMVPGLEPVERTLDVAAGDERALRLDFSAPVVVAASPPAALPALAPVEESSDTAAIVFGVTTGALAVSAVVMTIVTGVAQQDY